MTGESAPEPGQDDSALERPTSTLIREVTQLPDGRRLTLYARADPGSDNAGEP
jgi:hypothetical protein